jgi:calcineurin-like phosphoesterase family protein
MRPKVNIFVISDSHFNHWNINRYCNRGFDTLDDMNTTMFRKWNNVIKPTDIVIIVGDLVFTKGESKEVAKVIGQLNGRKILIKGNHDRKSYSWYLSNGIDFICERMIWEFNKKKVLFIHKHQDITHNDYRTCKYIIHGHSHNKGAFLHKRKQCKIVNVSTEQINFTPMNLVTLLNRLQQGYYDKGGKRK